MQTTEKTNGVGGREVGVVVQGHPKCLEQVLLASFGYEIKLVWGEVEIIYVVQAHPKYLEQVLCFWEGSSMK
jgi:hypothetical protein